MSRRSAVLILFFSIMLIVFISVVVGKEVQNSLNDKNSTFISFVDVGQGDAIFLSTKDRRQVLIDGGYNRQILSELGQLMPWHDRSIDVLIATHPDSDHIGGLIPVIERYRIDTIIDNGQTAESESFKRYQELKHKAENYVPVDEFINLDLGEVFITNLIIPKFSDDSNDQSVVTRIDIGPDSVLLTGDASQLVEQYLIDNYPPEILNVDILKLGHHGSNTSTSTDFLNATTPDHVIISADLNSRYGHPHDEVLDRLVIYGKATIWFTGSDGTITFEYDEELDGLVYRP